MMLDLGGTAGMIGVAISAVTSIVAVTGFIVLTRAQVSSLRRHVQQKSEAIVRENDKLKTDLDQLRKDLKDSLMQKSENLENANKELREDLNQLREDLKESVKELNSAVRQSSQELTTAATTIKVLATETSLINKMTTDALASLTRKVELHDDQIFDLTVMAKKGA